MSYCFARTWCTRVTLGIATIFTMLADILDVAGKAGTLPMQVLLLAGIIILGAVLKALHNDNKKTTAELIAKLEAKEKEHKLAVDALFVRLEAKEDAMTKERTDRISMLMQLIKDDVTVKTQIAEAQKQFAAAIDRNTSAIEDLKDAIRERLVKPT